MLLNKDLGVLAENILEGRWIFANTVKCVLMLTSSNFGNLFSAAGSSVYLSVLLILLNNLLYNAGQLVIPTDRVGPETLARPAVWDMAFIQRFISAFGLVSSIFGYLTYWVMLSILHAGHVELRTGCFVESIATQTLVIDAIRTCRGEISLVDLEPTPGAEANKHRPAVIMSNDGANGFVQRLRRRLVTIVPVTTNTVCGSPSRSLKWATENGLDRNSKARAKQVRSVAVERIGARAGVVPQDDLAMIDEALGLQLAF